MPRSVGPVATNPTSRSQMYVSEKCGPPWDSDANSPLGRYRRHAVDVRRRPRLRSGSDVGGLSWQLGSTQCLPVIAETGQVDQRLKRRISFPQFYTGD